MKCRPQTMEKSEVGRCSGGGLEDQSGFVSPSGLKGIVVCLLAIGGLFALGRLVWPELATPWLVLLAVSATSLLLLMIILLMPDDTGQGRKPHPAASDKAGREESES